MTKYDRRRHSKTRLMAHLILVTKYRKELTANGIWNAIKNIMYEICTDLHVVVMEMKCDKDHIHILLRYPPVYSITQIVSRLKQITTYRLWKKYPHYLKKLYWKEHTLWSDGYFACSVGDASKETIEAYIKNQGWFEP